MESRRGAARVAVGIAAAVLFVGSRVFRERARLEPHASRPPAETPPAAPPAPAPSRTKAPRPRRAAPAAPALQVDPAAPPFSLVEVSTRVGVVNVHQKIMPTPLFTGVEPWLRSIGAYVAVVDFDGDGWPDVFLANSAKGSKNRLYRNNHDGTFTDVAEKAGLADAGGEEGSFGGGLFFDYDDDGRKDFLLLGLPCAKLYHNGGDGTFADVTEASGLKHCGNSFAANAIDYDGDGRPDVVIGDYFKAVDFYHPATSRIMPNSMVGADNGGPIAVFHNDGGGKFSPAPDNAGVKSRGWTQAVGVYDLRGTGRRDLWFATDFGDDQVYFNEGGGRFSDASKLVGRRYATNGMSAEIADVDNDGRATAFVTNIYEPGYKVGRNLLWKWNGTGFTDMTDRRGADRCGWAWGAKFADLDDDGLQDLVVANGYISANPKKSYWYFVNVMGMADRSVMEDARNWPFMGDASWSGYQKKCVYRNVGGRFEDVTDAVGLGEDRSDGRGVATIDYMNDGRLSVIIANQGQPVHFYENRPNHRNHWIGFSLQGTRSGRDAFGARVTVALKDMTLTRELEPANGFMSESDPRLHFGLGPAPEIVKVTVRWPSGTVQELAGLKPDRYHSVVEPAP